MTVLVILLAVLLVLTLLLFLKVGVIVSYDGDFKTDLKVGPITVKFKSKKKSKNNQTASAGTAKAASKKKSNPWLKAAMEYWQEIMELIGRVLRAPTLDELFLKVDVGASEPDQCAMRYGVVCGSVGALLAPVENTFTIKKRSVDIQCCFDKTQIDVNGRLKATLKVYEIIALAVSGLKLGFTIYRRAKTI